MATDPLGVNPPEDEGPLEEKLSRCAESTWSL